MGFGSQGRECQGVATQLSAMMLANLKAETCALLRTHTSHYAEAFIVTFTIAGAFWIAL